MPVIVDEVLEVTAEVVIVNWADLEPATIETKAGTVADVLLDDRVTVIPPAGAFPVSVAVPVEVVPPTTVLGASVRLVRVGAWIARGAVFCDWLRDAVTVSVSSLATGLVVIAKVAVVAPIGTETVAGNWPSGPEIARLTTTGAEAGGCEIVTVPVLEFPPVSDVGLSATPVTVNGLTVRVTVCEID